MFTVRITKRVLIAGESGWKKRGDLVPNLSRDKAFYLMGLGVAELVEGDDTQCNFETKDGRLSSSVPASPPAE